MITYVQTKQFILITVITSLLWKICAAKKTHCLSIPTLPTKVDYFIRSCQHEIKSNIIDDLVYATLNNNHYSNVNHHDLLVKHIEYLSKNPHSHHSHYFPSGFEYFHDAYSHDTPHFISPHSYHTFPHRHPNSLNLHDLSSGDYSPINFGNQFNSAFPTVDDIVAEPSPKVQEEKIIEANEELMNILSNHKVAQRDVRRNYTLSHPRFRKIMKRSLLDMLTVSKWSTPSTPIPTVPVLPLHPVLLSGEDRWLAGCLMHCIFQKTHSLDRHGYPTLDGLVDLYTSGTNDQIYFIFTLRAVNKCLKLVSYKHHIYKGKYPHKAETCDIAFDVFDCISDSIAYYCNS